MTPIWNAIAHLVCGTVALIDRIAVWWGYWPCTFCGERTWDIEQHVQTNHAGDEGLRRVA